MKGFSASLLVLSVCAIVAPQSHSQSVFTESAKTGLPFLRIAPVARNSGMGASGVSLSGGASDMWWNPALLASLPARSAQFTHTDLVEGIRQEYAAFGTKTSIGHIGVAVQLFDSGDIDAYGDDASPLGSYSIKYTSLSATYAGRVFGCFDFGATYKKLFEKVSEEDAGGYAVDVGFVVHTPIEGLTAGAAARNMGRMDMLRSERTKLPTDFATGLAWKGIFTGIERPFVTTAEYVAPRYGKKGMRIGLEVEPVDRFLVRAGYRGDSDTEDMSCGVGIIVGRFSADASFTPMDEFNENALRFTLSLTGF